MVYNPTKLHVEITQAGVPIDGCDSNGKVDYKSEATAEQIDLVERPVDGIKALHNPDTLLPVDQVQADAKGDASSIPNYATWTKAQFQTWFDANLSDAQVDLIGSLADAKVMLKRQNSAINALAKLVIALRNLEWPDLQA